MILRQVCNLVTDDQVRIDGRLWNVTDIVARGPMVELSLSRTMGDAFLLYLHETDMVEVA